MVATVEQLAQWLGGEVVGDGEVTIRAARPLGEAETGDITFADDERHLKQLHHSHASAVVVPLGAPSNGKPLIRVPDPLLSFARLVERFRPPSPPPSTGIHPSACVHASAAMGAEATIGLFAVIGPGCRIGDRCRIGNGVSVGANCRLGNDVVLHPHVVLYDGTILGDRVTIHANSVIGADGFGFRDQDGVHVKSPQLGHVEIADDVEIGACTTIDKGTFGATRIGAGTKIDNLVMIAHNCQIGRRNLLCSQVGIAGSSSTGDEVIMAGQVGLRDHIHIGKGAIVLAQSGVRESVPDGARVLGYPALPESTQARIWATVQTLPAMRRLLKRIQKQLGIADVEES